MQTTAELRTQITQVQGEMTDISRSLDRLTSTTDLLGAKAELRDRAELLDLLQERLTKAQAREVEDEKRRGREKLEAERVAAREDFDRLTKRFDAVAEPLISHIVRELDTLTELAIERQQAHNQHLSAANQLNWGDSWGGRELTRDFGWTAKGEGDPTGIRRALFPLFAARRGIDVTPEGLAKAEYLRQLLNQPRPQQPAPTPLPDVETLAENAGVTLPFDR